MKLHTLLGLCAMLLFASCDKIIKETQESVGTRDTLVIIWKTEIDSSDGKKQKMDDPKKLTKAEIDSISLDSLILERFRNCFQSDSKKVIEDLDEPKKKGKKSTTSYMHVNPVIIDEDYRSSDIVSIKTNEGVSIKIPSSLDFGMLDLEVPVTTKVIDIYFKDGNKKVHFVRDGI